MTTSASYLLYDRLHKKTHTQCYSPGGSLSTRRLLSGLDERAVGSRHHTRTTPQEAQEEAKREALKAKKKMNDLAQYDAWQHADGRFFSYLKSKEERDVHDDDQYAAPGAQATPEYNSDGEYSPDSEGRDVAPAEWRQRNYEVEVAKAEVVMEVH